MGRRLRFGSHTYRGFTIIRRPYETTAVFKDGRCIASGIPSIQSARQWVDATLKGQDHEP